MNNLELRLALRNVFRQGLRSLMPVLVSAIACLVIILIGGLYEYLFRNLEITAIQTDGHIRVKAASHQAHFMTAERLAQIQAIPGVTLATPRSAVSGLVGKGDQSSVFSGLVVDPAQERQMHQYGKPARIGQSSSDAAANPTGARVGILLAKGLEAAPGEWLSGLAGNQGFSAPVGALVQTEAEEKDRFYLELPFASLGSMPWKLVDSVQVQIRPDADLGQVTAAIRRVFAGGAQPEISTYGDPEGYINSVKTIYGNNLLFIMIVLAIAVFLAVATAFSMAIAERSAELGTIRSIGAPLNHIRRLFQYEALFVSVFGFAAGLVLTALLASLINGLGGLVLPPPPTTTQAMRVGFVFQPSFALVALAILVGVGQLSTLFVTNRIGRMSIIKQLGLNS